MMTQVLQSGTKLKPKILAGKTPRKEGPAVGAPASVSPEQEKTTSGEEVTGGVVEEGEEDTGEEGEKGEEGTGGEGEEKGDEDSGATKRSIY